ncbi:MAG: hypothetical protein ACOZAR_01840 [Patescibacteria group bacterium]
MSEKNNVFGPTFWQRGVNLLSIVVLLTISAVIIWFLLNLATGNIYLNNAGRDQQRVESLR